MSKNTLTFITDKKLSQRIRNRIRWDKRISLFDFQVNVKNGRVVIFGSADTPYKKDAVIEVVENTEGVLSVENLISIPDHYHRSDFELKRLLEKQIDNLEISSSEQISVEVARGKVKLSGIVHSKIKKAEAASIVWELSGVTDCLNLIKIIDLSMISNRAGVFCIGQNLSRASYFWNSFI